MLMSACNYGPVNKGTEDVPTLTLPDTFIDRRTSWPYCVWPCLPSQECGWCCPECTLNLEGGVMHELPLKHKQKPFTGGQRVRSHSILHVCLFLPPGIKRIFTFQNLFLCRLWRYQWNETVFPGIPSSPRFWFEHMSTDINIHRWQKSTTVAVWQLVWRWVVWGRSPGVLPAHWGADVVGLQWNFIPALRDTPPPRPVKS